MKSYSVTSEMAGNDRKRRALRVLSTAVFFAAFEMLFQVLWPFGMKLGPWWGFIFPVTGGVVFALMFELTLARLYFPYTLVVSDDSITVVYPTSEKTVRKAEVKTVTETRGNALHGGALRISKYGRIGTWFWGCIWIPTALPDYESIKALALRWRGPTRV